MTAVNIQGEVEYNIIGVKVNDTDLPKEIQDNIIKDIEGSKLFRHIDHPDEEPITNLNFFQAQLAAQSQTISDVLMQGLTVEGKEALSQGKLSTLDYPVSFNFKNSKIFVKTSNEDISIFRITFLMRFTFSNTTAKTYSSTHGIVDYKEE